MEMQKIDAIGATSACPSFTIARESILPALDILARHVVERRNTIPNLSNVRIDVAPSGEIRLTGTDLDLELTATLSGECERPGSTTVSAMTFRDIVKKAVKGADIRCNASDGRMLVASGRIRQNINTLPVDDFPSLQAMGEATLSGEFDAQELYGDLSRVSIAISTEETRYYLNGINVSIEGDLLCMAATDGHRLALVERPAADVVSVGFQSAIMPRKAVKIALGLLKGSGPDPVTLDMSASKMVLDCGDIVLRSKLIDGTFPDYRRVIPNEAYLTGSLSVESAELLQHCDAAKGQEGKIKALSVEIEGGSILAGVSGKSGYARPLSAEYDGTDCGFAFNAVYMADFAKLAPRLSLQTATFDGDRQGGSPILIHIEGMPEFTGVCMPVRKDDALPKPEPVRYVETIAAPGQAADLFGVERSCEIKPGPRAATAKEQVAYLVDYAKRCGLPILETKHLNANGLTFGLICDARTVYPTKTDKWGYEHPDHSKPGVYHPAEYQEGAYSIPMPGRNQAPVTVEMMGDDGGYSAPMLCTDAKGRIALPDAPKVRKGKAKAAKAIALKPEPKDDGGFGKRVDYAAAVIAGNRATSREFDSCFENYDGDAVVYALLQRAKTNEVLAANLPRYIAASSLAELDGKFDGMNIADVARDLRARFDTPISEPAPAATVSAELGSTALPAPPIGAQSENNRGYFIVENATDKAIAHYPDYDSAKAAHNAMEPDPSFPNKVWPHIWRYMICAAYSVNDCRADLIAMTERYFADVALPHSAPQAQQIDNGPTEPEPEPEIAPQDEKIALPEPMEAGSDPFAALIARLGALERAVEAIQATPSGAMESDTLDQVTASLDQVAPLPDELKPKRSAAHVRAIMAYLAMRRDRKEREQWRAMAEKSAAECLELRKQCDDWEGLQHRTWEQSMGFKMKRRRAVLKARDLQKRLHVEHALVDKLTAAKREVVADMLDMQEAHKAAKSSIIAERDAARAEIAEMKRRIADPTNPARESDLLLLKGNAEAWQAKAQAAIAESERLKRLALQNAGHIETLASRIAKAESMLRDQGLWPSLTVIEPPMPVAA